MSLQNWPLLDQPRFLGLGNYLRLWSDAAFWASLRFTALYTRVVTVAIFGTALPLALLPEKPGRFVGLILSLVFLPMSLGLATVSLLWLWLLNTDSGLFGPALQALGVTAGRVNALGEFSTAMPAIVAMVAKRAFANPRVRQDAGCVALKRGPLVYCFEAVDNGPGLHGISLPISSPNGRPTCWAA